MKKSITLFLCIILLFLAGCSTPYSNLLRSVEKNSMKDVEKFYSQTGTRFDKVFFAKALKNNNLEMARYMVGKGITKEEALVTASRLNRLDYLKMALDKGDSLYNFAEDIDYKRQFWLAVYENGGDLPLLLYATVDSSGACLVDPSSNEYISSHFPKGYYSNYVYKTHLLPVGSSCMIEAINNDNYEIIKFLIEKTYPINTKCLIRKISDLRDYIGTMDYWIGSTKEPMFYEKNGKMILFTTNQNLNTGQFPNKPRYGNYRGLISLNGINFDAWQFYIPSWDGINLDLREDCLSFFDKSIFEIPVKVRTAKGIKYYTVFKDKSGSIWSKILKPPILMTPYEYALSKNKSKIADLILKSQTNKSDMNLIEKKPVLENSPDYTKANEIEKSMIYVPGGEYTMGRETGEGEDWELPSHKEVISPFYMSKYEITQALWLDVMKYNPSYYYSGDLLNPVENVSWIECLKFCNKLSEINNLMPVYNISDTLYTFNPKANGYRLPTESEWEFAAKFDSPSKLYSGSNSLDSVGWYYNNYSNWTHKVGLKLPNSLGLFDLCGNVGEWCWDQLTKYNELPLQLFLQSKIQDNSEVLHTVRGGTIRDESIGCRVNSRNCFNKKNKYELIGLRVCRNK